MLTAAGSIVALINTFTGLKQLCSQSVHGWGTPAPMPNINGHDLICRLRSTQAKWTSETLWNNVTGSSLLGSQRKGMRLRPNKYLKTQWPKNLPKFKGESEFTYRIISTNPNQDKYRKNNRQSSENQRKFWKLPKRKETLLTAGTVRIMTCQKQQSRMMLKWGH